MIMNNGQHVTWRNQKFFIYHRFDKKLSLLSRIVEQISFGGFPFKTEFIGEFTWSQNHFVVGSSKFDSLGQAIDLLLALESARKLAGCKII